MPQYDDVKEASTFKGYLQEYLERKPNTFEEYLGRNVNNVKSDLEKIYPQYKIIFYPPNFAMAADCRLDRIILRHNKDFILESIEFG